MSSLQWFHKPSCLQKLALPCEDQNIILQFCSNLIWGVVSAICGCRNFQSTMILARCTGTLRIRLSCLLIHFVWTELVPARTGTGGTNKPPCNCIHRCMTMRKYVCMCSMPHLLAKIAESNFICFGCSYTFFSHDHRKHWSWLNVLPGPCYCFSLWSWIMHMIINCPCNSCFLLISYMHNQMQQEERRKWVQIYLWCFLKTRRTYNVSIYQEFQYQYITFDSFSNLTPN